MALALIEIIFDALGFAQQVWRVFLGQLGEFFEGLQGLPEFLGKFLVFLVLPGVTQRRKAGVEQDHPVFDFGVKALQFFSEPPHLLGIHDCLGHITYVTGCWREDASSDRYYQSQMDKFRGRDGKLKRRNAKPEKALECHNPKTLARETMTD
jgi:hypothetical protein